MRKVKPATGNSPGDGHFDLGLGLRVWGSCEFARTFCSVVTTIVNRRIFSSTNKMSKKSGSSTPTLTPSEAKERLEARQAKLEEEDLAKQEASDGVIKRCKVRVE